MCEMKQKDMPLVSVHMITYNHEAYIAQAIEGVLAQQTSFPYELIIGEDCSTDRTREIVQDYADRYPEIIRVITSETNVGARKNSHRIMMAARGKYIAFCEGDDYWIDPSKLEKQISLFADDPDIVLVHSVFYVLNMKTGRFTQKITNRADCVTKDKLAGRVLTQEYLIATPTVCILKDLLVKIRNSNPSLFSKEILLGDLQIWVEAAIYGTIGLINEPLAVYRVLEESASRSKNVSREMEFYLSVRNVTHQLLEKYDFDQAVVSKCIHDRNSILLSLAYHSQNYAMASNAYNDILSYGLRPTLRETLLYQGIRNHLVGRCLYEVIHIRRKLLCMRDYLKTLWTGSRISDTRSATSQKSR